AGAMDFDRAWRNVEVIADRLVGKAGDDAGDYLALARGERGQFAVYRLTIVRTGRSDGCSSVANAVDQHLILEWLFDEVERARFHGRHRHWHVAVAGYDDRRDADAPFTQIAQKLDTVDVGHAQIGHQAAIADA